MTECIGPSADNLPSSVVIVTTTIHSISITVVTSTTTVCLPSSSVLQLPTTSTINKQEDSNLLPCYVFSAATIILCCLSFLLLLCHCLRNQNKKIVRISSDNHTDDYLVFLLKTQEGETKDVIPDGWYIASTDSLRSDIHESSYRKKHCKSSITANNIKTPVLHVSRHDISSARSRVLERPTSHEFWKIELFEGLSTEFIQLPETDVSHQLEKNEGLLQSAPDISELNNLVGASIPSKWELFGVQVRLEQSYLDCIRSDYHDSITRFLHVFNQWKIMKTSDFTWATVIKVLYSKSINEYTLAENIIKNLKRSRILGQQ